MTPTDWRALCEELVSAWDCVSDSEDSSGYERLKDSIEDVRAALAAEADGPAVPEGEPPIWCKSDAEQRAWQAGWEARDDVMLRPLAPPAPPAEGEGLPSDQEIADVFSQGCRDLSCSHEPPFLGGARAILARWGRPAPVPAPPAEGEVAELAHWLRIVAIEAFSGKRWHNQITRAADLLEQRHSAPVPVSERLPGVGNCNVDGMFWWGRGGRWALLSMRQAQVLGYTHWLPATALPLPAGEVEA